MKTKNEHILTFSEKMQISAILCFATCDWFCPMTSHIIKCEVPVDRIWMDGRDLFKQG